MIDLPVKFPAGAKVDKVIPKKAIYEHAAVTSKIKNLFIEEIDQIKWKYKLAPDTVNLQSSKNITEIQIFNINFRLDTVSTEVLKTIDQAMPYPIIFELTSQYDFKYAMCYKRPSESDSSKWIISDYFFSQKYPLETNRNPMPVVLKLEQLYHGFLIKMLPVAPKNNESIESMIMRVDQINMLNRQIKKLESKIKREKQFNRRVEANRLFNQLNDKIKKLKI